MKIKKRLQTLVAVLAMLSMICGSLPAVHAVNIPIPEEDSASYSYRASDYFDISANPYAPWQWEKYDSHDTGENETAKYTLLEFSTPGASSSPPFSNTGNYPHPNDDDGRIFARQSGNNVGVGKYWMRADVDNTVSVGQYYGVRTFVAPKGGTVTITADNKNEGKSGSIQGTNYDNNGGAKIVDNRGVRIVREKANGSTEAIWPTAETVSENKYAEPETSRYFMKVPHGKKGTGKLDFTAIEGIELEQGDKLHFEVANIEITTDLSRYEATVYWDPVVTYTDITIPEYQASKEFVGATSNLGRYNPGNNWDWNCYVYGDQINWASKDYPGNSYSPMTVVANNDGQTFLDTGNYPIPQGEDVVKEVYALSGEGVGIGKYWMRGFRIIDSADKQGYFGRVYAVRTFKAKESGEVTISAVDRFGKSAIEGAHVENASDEKNQRGVRVMQESGGVKTQLWPTEQNKGASQTITHNDALFALVPKDLTIDFPTLTTTLQAGDKLHFELANVSPDPNDDSRYGCAVYWDPKVSYITGVVAKGSNVTFTNEDGNLTDFSSIVNSTKDVTVTIPVTARYTKVDSVVPIAAVYNQDGALVSYAIGTSGSLAMNKPTELTVTLEPITENKPSDGYIKVFLWNSVEELMPLSDIGAEPVLGTALGESEKVYAGTGEPGQEVTLLIKNNNGNMLYIEQGAVDENGRFRVPIPAGLENNTIQCNLSGELIEANCLYASNAGESTGAGTMSSPLSFQKALELAKDGEKIIVMDEIVLPEDFVWPTEKKHVTVSGSGNGAALNIYLLINLALYIRTDATFENLVLASTQAGNASSGTIRACGNVVTIKDSVSTRGIFGAFYGGARNWDEVDKTETYVYGGNFNRIYGGGGHVLHDCKLTVGGNTNTTAGVDPTKEKNGIFEPYIYGGTLDNTVEGDCITTITGDAAALYLYGGSQDDKTNSDRGAGVKGKTVVNLEGGKFMNVYGMNPPSPKTSDEKVNYTADVTINMTGGTVEALIGSTGDTLASDIKANIVINALGGTVTRRIMGGVYNDLQKSGRKNITGTTAVRIGGGMKGLTDNQVGNGIIAGTRTETKPEDETATLIFLDGTYEKYKKNITHNNSGSYSDGVGADWCDSNYNYLVTATTGGDIVPEGGNQITVKPDDGYTAYIGGESVTESYTLSSARTDVVFTNDGPPPLIPAISALSGTADASGVQATITYTAADDTNTLMLALYDNDSLVVMVHPSVQRGIHTNQEITIPCALQTGKEYILKAFLWSGMENIVPLCKAKDAKVTAQQ